MATFDFKGVYVATYSESGAEVTYQSCTEAGKPIDCDIQFKAAEGRLHAKGALDKYRKKNVGGTVSMVASDVPTAVRQLMSGEEESVHKLTGGSAGSVTGLKGTDKTVAPYVGFAAYAPDDINGEEKFTAVFLPKTLFSAPGFKFKTVDTQINFQVPTIVGEFMRAADGVIYDFVTVDTEADAIAWCKERLGGIA